MKRFFQLMASTEDKAGFFSTEFWQSIAAMIIFVLVVAGFFDSADQSDLVEVASRIVAAVFVIVENSWYIISRFKVKTERLELESKKKPEGQQ